ncbi:beta-glucosidase [Isoptericola haloaureus]|uniref:Glycoside hydrolase family 3 N-terminal domain-containing protein n=1 Tax=Isoptericola haloaureus TaxID=1542902 RepID=A0ABU7Z2I5_9MICO
MNERAAGIGQVDSSDRLAQGRVQLRSEDAWIPEGMGETCRRAAAEGIVLLTNENEALPLSGSAPIAVFGRVQRDYFTVGYGSGGDVRPPYSWNLVDALAATDLQVDAPLAERYATWCDEHPVDPEPAWGTWPRSHPEMPLTTAEVEAVAARTPTAVVVLGRAAGEAREQSLTEGGYHLTADERTLLSQVSTAFERTVVVVDTGNVVDLAWTREYDLDAVLLAWQGGMESGRAVADVLTGAVPAGGKLTATIATAYDRYPSAGHFGGHEHNEYVEDVYVGYRWFETFAAEDVLFPFGFGLTYASFDVRARDVRADDGEVVVRAEVTNTHAVHPGTEVVQVYVRAPQGVLGRPARHLAAFAKTRELAPGASQTLELRFRLEDLAAYDDGGATGHRSAYVLEAGRYEVLLGTDVRSALPCGGIDVEDLRVVRQVAEAAAVEPAHAFDRVVARTGPDGAPQVAHAPVPVATVSRRDRVLAGLPAAVAQTGDAGVHLADVAAGRADLDTFVAQLDDDELEALSRGDFTMDSALGAAGNAGALAGTVPSLRAKGVPALTTTDGPAGIRLATHTALLPCGTALASTWNVELVTELNTLLAAEMAAKGSDVLLSPGMNVQRDPLCGRNFEYFSEDPLLTGRMAAATVRGIQSGGLAACPKHFAANNQEDNREHHDSRVSERALREIYLRGFEICVAESAPRTLMTSYNKINGVWGHYHHDLVTTILRGEWGFDGAVMTDWWMREAVDPDFPAVTNDAYRVRAQVDVHMPGAWGREDRHGDGSLLASLAADDGLTRGELQRTARNVLRLALTSPRVTGGA